MYNDKILILFSIIVLVSLFCGIKGDFGIIKEQEEIAPGSELEKNLDTTPSESVITTAITEDDEKFDDNELGKLFVQNFKSNNNSEAKEKVNGTLETPRITRDTNDTHKNGMQCFSCFGNGNSKKDEDCYKGIAQSITCSDVEQCFVELNPLYLRRGCAMAERINKTFYCRCPLCNNKPSMDDIYYDYKSVHDWAFDNYLLQKPLVGLDLMCKVCETSGTNPVTDKMCRQGKSVDYMVCANNQICYTNIDDEIDHVSRGCKTRPAYNSIYFFCNKSGCNNDEHVNPRLTLRTMILVTEKKSSRSNAKNLQFYQTILVLSVILFISKIYIG